MKSGFYGAAIAAVAGLALGGLLKGPFSAEAADAPMQTLFVPQAQQAAYAEAPAYYAPVAYAYAADDGGGAYLRASYEVDPAEALLQQAAWQEPAASPQDGYSADASAEAADRSANEAHAAGMTTPAVRPPLEPAAPLPAPAAPAAAQDFESIDALIGAMKTDSTEPA